MMHGGWHQAEFLVEKLIIVKHTSEIRQRFIMSLLRRTIPRVVLTSGYYFYHGYRAYLLVSHKESKIPTYVQYDTLRTNFVPDEGKTHCTVVL